MLKIFIFCLLFPLKSYAEYLPVIPPELPAPASNRQYTLPQGSLRLDPDLQEPLEEFIRSNGDHVAAVVVVDIKNSAIVAIAQGRSPKFWGSQTHTALYEGFPAASVFKTVSATALLDLSVLEPDQEVSLFGGCSKVGSSEKWAIYDHPHHGASPVSLRQAFATSCNGFFAKMAVNPLGLSIVNKYAESYGWGRNIPVDFMLKASPIHKPEAKTASLQTIGKFTAGFGQVGMSAVHGAWIFQGIANDGVPKGLRLFQKTLDVSEEREHLFFQKETGPPMREMMNQTVQKGSASQAFKKPKYRHLVPFVGGKTGTLNSNVPKGTATWFVGFMPYHKPEVVVAAVVIIDEQWRIRGPHLAAEAFYQWNKKHPVHPPYVIK